MKKKLRDIGIDLLLIALCIVLPTPAARAAALTEIRMGRHETFNRIVFEFRGPVRYQIAENGRSGRISVTFFDVTSDSPHVPKSGTLCVDSLTATRHGDELTADILLNSPHFRLAPFIIQDPVRLVIDIYCDGASEAPAAPAETEIPAAPVEAEIPAALGEAEAPPAAAAEPIETSFEKIVAKAPLQQDPLPGLNMQAASRMQRPQPNESAWFQSTILLLLALLSLIIFVLAGMLIFQKRSSRNRVSTGSGSGRPMPSGDILNSIDAEIRKKLQSHVNSSG